MRDILIDSYNSAVENYLIAFCKKHELDINDGYWVGGEIGGIYDIADCYFAFKDIKFDVDNNIEGDKIFDWYDYSIKVAELSDGSVISEYKDWLKGERPFTEEDMQKIEEAMQRVNEAKALLEKSIEEALGFLE